MLLCNLAIPPPPAHTYRPPSIPKALSTPVPALSTVHTFELLGLIPLSATSHHHSFVFGINSLTVCVYVYCSHQARGRGTAWSCYIPVVSVLAVVFSHAPQNCLCCVCVHNVLIIIMIILCLYLFICECFNYTYYSVLF